MKNKKLKKKLFLNKVTISNLEENDMTNAKGGVTGPWSRCVCPSYVCVTIAFSCYETICCPIPTK